LFSIVGKSNEQEAYAKGEVKIGVKLVESSGEGGLLFIGASLYKNTGVH
jgi:hypothetical protein